MTVQRTTLWWIRHAPVVDNGGLVYGQGDIEADCSDPAPFAGLARVLPRDAVWITSQLRRTRETAEAIGRAGLALPDLAIDPDLAEQDFGDWQGQNRDEIHARSSDWRRFWLCPAETAAPGGESFADVMARTRRAVDRILAAHGGRDVVVVAHGGTIRAALGHALELSPAAAVAFHIDNLSLTRLDHLRHRDGMAAWRVVHVNRHVS